MGSALDAALALPSICTTTRKQALANEGVMLARLPRSPECATRCALRDHTCRCQVAPQEGANMIGASGWQQQHTRAPSESPYPSLCTSQPSPLKIMQSAKGMHTATHAHITQALGLSRKHLAEGSAKRMPTLPGTRLRCECVSPHKFQKFANAYAHWRQTHMTQAPCRMSGSSVSAGTRGRSASNATKVGEEHEHKFQRCLA